MTRVSVCLHFERGSGRAILIVCRCGYIAGGRTDWRGASFQMFGLRNTGSKAKYDAHSDEFVRIIRG